LTEEKKFHKKNFQAQDSTSCFHKKLCKTTCLGCTKHSQAWQLSRKDSKFRSSLTKEPESKTFLEDLPMRQRPVKSPFLHLGFSSSSELEESSLKKSKLLRVGHTRDTIFWNFFFFLSPKRYFFLLSPLMVESFRLV
jgi:hypothetical protein